jgi:hypothetical protein
MPRDSNGAYTLPASVNPVVNATTIDPAWANTTLDDIRTALTDSLDRNGRGGMLASFKNADGTIGAPGMSWTNETASGFRRAGAGDMRAVIGGADVARFTAAGILDGAGNAVWTAATFTPASKADAAITVTGTGSLTGGGNLTSNRTLDVADDGISNAKLRNSAGVSLIGRSAGTSGDPADIAATADNQFMVRRAGALTWGVLVGTDIPGHNQAWSTIIDRPTTLSGYGITDAASNTISISAGTGLTGGGTLAATRTLSFDQSYGDARYQLVANMDSYQLVSGMSAYVLTTRTIGASTGLTGGGDLTTNRSFSFDTSWGDARYRTISSADATYQTIAGMSAYVLLNSAPQFTGLVRGRNGGRGMGQISISTSGPSGGADGDIWFRY